MLHPFPAALPEQGRELGAPVLSMLLVCVMLHARHKQQFRRKMICWRAPPRIKHIKDKSATWKYPEKWNTQLHFYMATTWSNITGFCISKYTFSLLSTIPLKHSQACKHLFQACTQKILQISFNASFTWENLPQIQSHFASAFAEMTKIKFMFRKLYIL